MDGIIYKSLSDAIASAATSGGVVTLRGKGKNSGIAVPEGSNFTLDLNGNTLTMEGPGAGSEGTKTNAMQLLKGSKITIKNGTLSAKNTPEIKMLIQNYADLTLDNVILEGSENCLYLCSNNYGNVEFKNGTTFNVVGNNAAFDAWYGLNSQGLYDDPGVFVKLDESVEINGRVEFGKQGRASWDNFEGRCMITAPSNKEVNVTLSSQISEGEAKWVDNGDGTKSFKYIKN